MNEAQVREAAPDAAWAALSSESAALLIDVRTNAEWSFVGIPDLTSIGGAPVLIEWQSFPTMAHNPGFVAQAMAEIERAGARDVYFICRSGVRSMHAAMAVAGAAGEAGRDVRCVNVVEGFEGDLSAEGKRGVLRGWKARDLPWRQS